MASCPELEVKRFEDTYYGVTVTVTYNDNWSTIMNLELCSSDAVVVSEQLSRLAVELGDGVSSGDSIGNLVACSSCTSSSGVTYPIHLHWAVTTGESSQCPADILDKSDRSLIQSLFESFHFEGPCY